MSTLTLTLNGTSAEVPAGTTLRQLVAETIGREVAADGTAADGGRLGVAVAVDRHVVPRSAWDATVPRDGAAVDLVTAVQGG